MNAKARGRGASGFTLVELLVAMAIALILVAGLWRFFLSQQKTFTAQDEVTQMQQKARIAEDFMLKAIQQAGAHNPVEGVTRGYRPPAILAASDRYIAVQYDDPAGTTPGVVSADEVVVFALGKDGNGSTETVADDPAATSLEVYYDANNDGEIDDTEAFRFTIPMDLSGPPYNLYRITPDPSGPNSPPIRELIATNVDNLVLRYYDQNGNRLPSDPVTKVPKGFGGTDSVLNVEERKQVRLVEVELLLRGDNQDPSYTPSSPDEVTLEDGSVGTYDATGTPAANFVFTGDAAQYRRRSYRTLITPRSLGLANCGSITLTAPDVNCPDDADILALVVDKDGRAVEGAPVSFYLPGAPIGASLSTTVGTTDASGMVTATLHYQKLSRSITVAANAEVSCEGVPVTLSHAIPIGFLPGAAARAYSWAEPDPDGNNDTLFGLLPDPSYPPDGDWFRTCREDKYQYNTAILDFCGNTNVTVPVADPLVFTTVDENDPGTAFGEIDPTQQTTNPQRYTVTRGDGVSAGTQSSVDGHFSQLVQGNIPSWLEFWAMDQNTPPRHILTYTDPAAQIPWLSAPFPHLIRTVDVWPFPATNWRWAGLNDIDAYSPYDERIPRQGPPNVPPDRWMDTRYSQFQVLDCSNQVPVYTLLLPTPQGYVEAKLTGGSTTPTSPLGAIGDLENANDIGSATVVEQADDVQNFSLKNDIRLHIYEDTAATPGFWDIGYNWPFCAVDPGFFSITNPAKPDITLTAMDNPEFTGIPLTKTPEIPPGRTCTVVAQEIAVTPCRGETTVTVGGCDFANKEMELEIISDIGDPHWLEGNVQPDPKFTFVTTDATGYKTVKLAVGDTTPTGTKIEVRARARPDAAGEHAFSCPDNGTQDEFVVDNVCTNFRAFYRNALGEVDMQNGGRYCATVLNELFVEILHCMESTADLVDAVKVEVYDEFQDPNDPSALQFDQEFIDLKAQDGPPATIFRGSIEMLAQTLPHGREPNLLEYPKGKAGKIKIHPWVNPADPADTCPTDPWIIDLIPPVPICFPNAITSGGGASWNGNFKVHWGDVVVRGNMTKPSAIIEKLPNGQFDGGTYLGKSSLTDRFVDVYVGRSDSGIPDDGLISGYPLPSPWTGYIYQPFLPIGGGNYYTNISREKISKMIVSLDYEVMKELALNHSKNTYWVAVPSTPYPKVYNPRTGIGPLDLSVLLNNPNTPSNPNNDGNFLFIDTWGVPSAGKWLPPSKTGMDIDNAALADTLPAYSISGNPFYTTGIIYIAGSLGFGGLGVPRTVLVETPPGKDMHYDHNNPSVFTPTDDNIPVRPDPAEPREHFEITVHINGAIYLDGDYRGAGNPLVYGALTSERGYSGLGTPEVWYNYLLNETGIQNALCVECCTIAARPSLLDLMPGDSATLTITNFAGALIFRSSDPTVATVDQNGTVTAVANGFATVWVVDENNCTVAVPVRTSTTCVGLKIIPEMVPDPNDPADTFDLSTGVEPVEVLTITNPNDPTGGYPLAHWVWTADKNPAGQDIVTVDPQGVANPPANVGNNYTAIITGKRCGITTVKAVDETGVCTSIYETTVTVGSALDITGIDPNKPDYRVGETVTLTATGGTGLTYWHTLPSANVSLSANSGPTTQMTFLNPGIVQVDVSDDLNCVSDIHDFYAVCSQVSGTAISPQWEGYGIDYGRPTMVWRVDANDDFGPNPYDQIDRVEFYVWPDPATETGSLYIGSDSTPPYCAFGDDGAGGCLGGDVTTWQTGWYNLEAKIITKPYSCGAHQTSVWTGAYVSNCKMRFYDYFDTASPNPAWQGTCLNDGCNLAMSKFYNSGGRMVLELKNKTSSFGPYFVTLNPASVPVTLAEDFYQYALFYGSSPVGNSAIGLSTLSTAGYHVTVFGAPFLDTDGTVSYNMKMVYNTGSGDVNPAPTSGSGTVLKAPFYIEIWQENGVFYGYAWDGTGRWTYWSTGITLPNAGTYYNGVILNGPATYDAPASGTVDFFYQTCY